MKSFYSLIALIILSLAFTACGEKTESSDSQKAPTTLTAANAKPTTAATAKSAIASTAESLVSTNDGKVLLKVSEIKGAEAIQEFQKNVALLQAQRNGVQELQKTIETTIDTEKRKKLEQDREALLKKIQENNELMVKTYGFSLLRNYVMNIDDARIFMAVTPEEHAEIQKNQPKK